MTRYPDCPAGCGIARLGVAVVAVLIASLSAAAACRPGTPGPVADHMPASPPTGLSMPGPGSFVLSLDKNTASPTPLLTDPGHAQTFCGEYQMSATTDPKDSGSGPLIWYRAPDDYYAVELRSTGDYRVIHMLFQKSYVLIPYTDTAAITHGTAAWNEVEIDLQSDGADIVINKQRVNHLIATPVPEANQFGFYAESPAGGPASIQMRALRLLN